MKLNATNIISFMKNICSFKHLNDVVKKLSVIALAFFLVLLDPLVVEHLDDTDSLFGIFLDHIGDELLEVVADVGGELELAVDDFLHGGFFVGLVEGSLAGGEFVGEDADGPEVDGVVVLPSGGDFGGHVVDGAAEGLPYLVTGTVGGETHVCDFEELLGTSEGEWLRGR